MDWPSVVAAELQIDGATGRVDPADVRYADLTGDGDEEAVVPVTADGSAGVIGYYVFGFQAGRLVRLLARRGADMTMTVAGGRLVETDPVPAPGDPRCCPSQLRRTTFRWTGAAFMEESAATVPNPTR